MWLLSLYTCSNYTSSQYFAQIAKKVWKNYLPNFLIYLAIATTLFSRITVILILPG